MSAWRLRAPVVALAVLMIACGTGRAEERAALKLLDVI